MDIWSARSPHDQTTWSMLTAWLPPVTPSSRPQHPQLSDAAGAPIWLVSAVADAGLAIWASSQSMTWMVGDTDTQIPIVVAEPDADGSTILRSVLRDTNRLVGIVSNGTSACIALPDPWLPRLRWGTTSISSPEELRSIIVHGCHVHRAGMNAIRKAWHRHGRSVGAMLAHAACQMLNGIIHHPANEEARASIRSDLITWYRAAMQVVVSCGLWWLLRREGIDRPADDHVSFMIERYAANPDADDGWEAMQRGWTTMCTTRTDVPLHPRDRFPIDPTLRMTNRDLVRWMTGLVETVNDIASLSAGYEASLEWYPQVTATGTIMVRNHNQMRKQAGAYYTPPDLTMAIVQTTVGEAWRAGHRWPTVVDPSCGTGALLITAAWYLAMMQVQSESSSADLPSHRDLYTALQQVIPRCIYGVDRDPIAVFLARMHLWWEGRIEDRAWIDHLQCGDGLIGMIRSPTPAIDLPDSVYTPLEGDDPSIMTQWRRRNQIERSGQLMLEWDDPIVDTRRDPVPFLRGSSDAADAPSSDDARWDQWVADGWVAAFFQPTTGSDSDGITTGTLRRWQRTRTIEPHLASLVATIRQRLRPLHWGVVFADVMARGGFDVVIGNPPWERRDTRASSADDGWYQARIGRYMRWCGDYPYTGSESNLASFFVERMRGIVRRGGWYGVLIPFGLIGHAERPSLQAMIHRDIRLLVSMENRNEWFIGVDRRLEFAFLQAQRLGSESTTSVHRIRCMADVDHPMQWQEAAADAYDITEHDIARCSPNTHTVPILRTPFASALLRLIHTRFPVLVHDHDHDGNPWGFRIERAMSSLPALRRIDPAASSVAAPIPVYDGRMIHHYDHRFASYHHGHGTYRRVPDTEKTAVFHVQSRDWVDPAIWEGHAALQQRRAFPWCLGWRDITHVRNHRTMIASLLPPRVAWGRTLRVGSIPTASASAILLALWNSLVLDLIVRYKLCDVHLTPAIVKQLPVPPPTLFTESVPWDRHLSLRDAIVERVMTLVYTDEAMRPWATALGYDGPPFPFDPDRRARIRAEIEALCLLIYLGTTDQWNRDASPTLRRFFPQPHDAVRTILASFRCRGWPAHAVGGDRATILTLYETWERHWTIDLAERQVLSDSPRHVQIR